MVKSFIPIYFIKQFSRLLLNTIKALYLVLFIANTSYAGACGDSLQIVVDSESNFLEVDYVLNGIKSKQMITGENYFPTFMVMDALNITENNLKNISGNVLLTGLSYNGLLPRLLDNGVSTTALDLSYKRKNLPLGHPIAENMIEFNTLFGQHLIQGNALDMPFENNSYSNVWSYRLVSGTDFEFQTTYLNEVIRVLKKGGTAKIYGFDEKDAKKITKFLKKKYKRLVQFSFERRSTSWIMNADEKPNYDPRQPLQQDPDKPGRHMNFDFDDYLLTLQIL